MHFVSYVPNCMPLIQMSASYVDKEWPSVNITRSLWVLKKKSESPYTYIFTPGVILLNKKPNITIDIFKTFCVLIEVGKAREEVNYVMGEVPQWLVPNCNTYFFIFFILYIIIESTGCSEYTGSQCVTHPCNPFLLLLLPYRMKANLLFFPPILSLLFWRHEKIWFGCNEP